MYAAFNRRDIDLVVSAMTPDVDWANGQAGGPVLGIPAVRGYWAKQWKRIDPHVEPQKIEMVADGRVAVDVHQVVRNLDSAVLNDRMVQHVYTLRDGLIARMDIVEV
jgi:hypothetical protein